MKESVAQLSAQQAEILTLIAELDTPHVYELKRRVGVRSVYTSIMSLQARGLISARWEDSPHDGRPPRKVVQLTAEGMRALNSYKAELKPSSSPGIVPA